MTEEEKDNGSIQPAHEPLRLGSNDKGFDVSATGGHVLRLDTGEVAENPLAISDPVKRDNTAIFIRKGCMWMGHVLVFGVYCASVQAQLYCTPPREYHPPLELVAIIVGFYGGSSVNFIDRFLKAYQGWRNKGTTK